MTLLDSTLHYAIPALGVGARWLKEELRAQGIRVPLTESYLRDLVIDADASARQTVPSKDISHTYVSRFRAAIRARAEFVRAWTLSDDRIDSDAAFNDRMIKLAHAYALPRQWRLSEPVATESKHPTRTYLYWASVH